MNDEIWNKADPKNPRNTTLTLDIGSYRLEALLEAAKKYYPDEPVNAEWIMNKSINRFSSFVRGQVADGKTVNNRTLKSLSTPSLTYGKHSGKQS